MEEVFDLIGDSMPNSNEIHLEADVLKKELYKEYQHHMINIYNEFDYLSETVFYDLWSACFPHVKIRQYKAVSGKCFVCAALSGMRSAKQDARVREYVRELHAFHRSTYMGERKAYYANIKRALDNPSRYLSIISDGMSQSHTELPWVSNLGKAKKTITHHLQGLLQHGEVFVSIF